MVRHQEGSRCRGHGGQMPQGRPPNSSPPMHNVRLRAQAAWSSAASPQRQRSQIARAPGSKGRNAEPTNPERR
eukprot:1689529-Pleurochrysis_carterae.AAC.1